MSNLKKNITIKEDGLLSKRWLALIVLTIISGLVYIQAYDFGFVWDDRKNIVENSFLNPPSFQTILFFWKNQFLGMYVPVPYTFWGMIEMLRSLFSSREINALVFHLSNITIHTLNGFLVFFLLSKILKNHFAVLSATVFFLIHPLQTETVVWISESRGLLAMFFSLSSLIFYTRSISILQESKEGKLLSLEYIAAFLCFLLALLSKPSSAVVPLFAVMIELYLYKTKLKDTLIHVALWFLPIFLVILVTSSFQGNTQLYSFWVKPFIYFSSLSFYLYKIIVPFSLAPTYGLTPIQMMSESWFHLSWIFPLLVSGIIWKCKNQFPLLLLSWGIFAAGVLPVSGLVNFTFQDWSNVADRYVYLSMFGVSIFIGSVLQEFESKIKWVFILVIISSLSFWNFFVQVPIWKNEMTLWSHCVKKIHISPHAYSNLGLLKFKDKSYKEALLYLNRAIKISPVFPKAYNHRGRVFNKMNRYEEAMSDYNRSIRLHLADQEILSKENYLSLSDTYYNRAKLFKKKKEYRHAINDYKRSIKFNPMNSDSFNNLGDLYLLSKQNQKAISVFEKAVSLQPKKAIFIYNTGVAYQMNGEMKKALEYYNRALTLNDKFGQIYSNRAIIFFQQKNYKRSRLDLKKAQELGVKVNQNLLNELDKNLK
ncbi:MAG: tetratricopeptide repeat protein [Nitrospinota bacterium]|nr:tetratricopeptide repeat protein [Nitrospinota bacterium]